jgi:hypothetical protein
MTTPSSTPVPTRPTVRRLLDKRRRQSDKKLIMRGLFEFLQSKAVVFPRRGENIVMSLFK